MIQNNDLLKLEKQIEETLNNLYKEAVLAHFGRTFNAGDLQNVFQTIQMRITNLVVNAVSNSDSNSK